MKKREGGTHAKEGQGLNVLRVDGRMGTSYVEWNG